MPSDNEPTDHAERLEVIHRAKDSPNIDIIIVHGMGQDSRAPWMTNTTNEKQKNAVLKDLFVQINARVMVFNSKVDDSINYPLTNSLTRISETLLKELSLQRSENEKSQRTPIAFITRDLGGCIVKKALVIAEGDAAYCSISQDCTRLIFIDMIHRAAPSTGWDNLLSKTIFSSSLLSSQTKDLATQFRQISAFFEDLSVNFISLRARRCIINLYQCPNDEVKDGSYVHQAANHYSVTTGLVHEINIPIESKGKDIFNLLDDDYAASTIATCLKAEINSEYRACLSRLYEISPMFTLPDDQCDLYISNPGVEVKNIYDAWCETPLPDIITTGGPRGVGKSLNARTLFSRLKKSSTLVAYFSFTETDATRCSFEAFLGSVIFQVLNQNPERYSRIEDLFKTMNLSDAYTEAGLLVLFYSVLDTKNGLNPLYLIVDDLQRCDAALKLIEGLAEAVSNRSSLTRLKVALFYNTQQGKSHIIEEALQKLDHIRMHGPVLTVDMFKPLAATLADQIIINRPHLFELKQSLIAALEKCKHTSEMLLMVQALSVNDPKLNPRTPKAMKSIISSPQTPVREAISYTFDSLPNWGRTVLGWIVYSKRPLRLNELATAIALTNEKAEFSSTFDTDRLHVDFGSDVQFLFGPLVRFEGGGIIFSDTAVRDQFVELIEGGRKPKSATGSLPKATIPGDKEITGILLGYLSWQSFTTPVEEALRLEEFIRPQGELFHLMAYAVQFLPIHYLACMNSSEKLEPIQDRQFAMWSKLNSKLNSTPSPLYLRATEPFLLASYLGFTRMIKTDGRNIKHDDRSGAVSLASWAGHLDTVSELLVGECAISDEPVELEEALQYASARGHGDIIDFIVKYMKEKTPQKLAAQLDHLLCCAASLGYDKQAVLWIGLGANINTALDNITPLQLAAFNGHTPLIHLLLQYEGVDVDSKAGIELDSPLILAARKGYELMAQHLLTAGADITCVTKDEGERTPLYLAAEYGHQGIVRRLIADETQRHSILNRQSSSGNSPLMIACINGHSEIVKLLLDANASVTLYDHDDKTAVYHALRLHDEDLVMRMIEHADSAHKFKDIRSVFLRATELGFESVIRHCLGPTTQENKTSLMEYHDQEREEGKKALHYAAENGHIRIVKLLLSLGAEKDPVYQNGQTPLALAVQNGEAEIVRLLLSNGAETDANMSLCLSQVVRDAQDSTRHAEVIRVLLEKTNIDPNSTSEEYQQTPLHWAAQLGKIEMAKALLENDKTNPNARDQRHWNALHYMANGGQTSTIMAKLLIKAGTNPLASDFEGKLAIHLASKAGNIPLLELLLKLNPETVQAKTDDGRSVLHFGIESEECVECLLNHKADGNTRNDSGRTPLMVAAERGLDETVKKLLRFGCNAEFAIRDGRTALHFAAESGHIGVGRQLLQKHKEILSLKDAADLSAIHCAIHNREEAFTKMLLHDFYSKDHTLLGDLSVVMTEKGETPLIVAIKTDQTNIVCQLLELGVDTEHRDKDGFTALLAAVERPTDSCLVMIRALLDVKLSNRADVNSGGGVHPTALYNAAKYGIMEVVEELIRLGAQANVQGGQYNTALSVAAVNGYFQIAQFLLDLKEDKADPNLPAGDFANTLCAVLYFQTACDDLVIPLLNAGVKVSARDRQGRSAFHIAARRGSWVTLKQLLSVDRIDISPVDNQGRTLLHHVAMSGKLRPFLYVFKGEEAGRQGTVDWHGGMIKDNDGWTPLHWACRHKDNLDIVRACVLLFGANLAEATNDKWTPENIAITHNASNIAAFIRQRQSDTESPESGSDPEGKPKSRHSRWKIGQMHRGVYCDGCFNSPIYGVRWQCESCVKFNYCFKCYWTAKTTHDPNHSFRASPEGKLPGREPEYEEDGDDE
ncbi:ankyrin repeat-containing domain protein [Trichoderma sp. SZMC 28012]